MDRIEKALAKLTEKEQVWTKELLFKLSSGRIQGLDIKKLKGRDDIFRIRKGDIRVIYRRTNDNIFILSIERRNEKTYN
jgi:mRNA-degrading endonuclease RelE of RelBE toxin-antitoxin system